MLPPELIKESFKEKLRGAKLYSSSVTVSIALDCPAEALGFGEELIFVTRDDVSKSAHCDGNPHTSAISILAPAQRDKSLAPEGFGTLTLYVAGEISQNNNWMAEKDETGNFIRGEAYKKHKQEYAEILIKRISDRMCPELKSHILFYDIATPITHLRYTGNKSGSIMGAKPGKHNMQSRIAHHQTQVDRLILGGHWSELGGGVPIAVKAGINASLVILKKENKEAYKAVCRYMDGKSDLNSTLSLPFFKSYLNSWVQNPTPAERKALAIKIPVEE
jgi:prolycopene isomerase